MGIKDLNKVINNYMKTPGGISTINKFEMKNITMALDANMILYQYLSIQNNPEDYINEDGKSIIHIKIIMDIVLHYLGKNIKPVFVFDGKPPDAKLRVLKTREKNKETVSGKIEKINKKLKYIFTLLSNFEMIETKESFDNIFGTFKKLVAEKKQLEKRNVVITNKMIKECCEVLKVLGIPFIISPSEADFQCVHLAKKKLVDYVLSEDMDYLTLGVPKLLRKSKKYNVFDVYDTKKITKELGFTHKQFIDLCILLGCDYSDTIYGIGPVKAFKLVNEYKDIETILSSHSEILNGKFKVPENFNYKEAREIFNNPKVDDDYVPTWKKADFSKLKRMLFEKYKFREIKAFEYYKIFHNLEYHVMIGARTLKEDNEALKRMKIEEKEFKKKHDKNSELLTRVYRQNTGVNILIVGERTNEDYDFY